MINCRTISDEPVLRRLKLVEIQKMSASRIPTDNHNINLLSGMKFVNLSMSFSYTNKNVPYPNIPSAKQRGSTHYWNNICMDFTSDYPIILWPSHPVLASHIPPQTYDIKKRFVTSSDKIYPIITDEYLNNKSLKEIIRQPLSPSHMQGSLNSLPIKATEFKGFYTIPGRTLLLNVHREMPNAWHGTADGSFPSLLTIQDLIEEELNFKSDKVDLDNEYISFEKFKLNSIDFIFLNPTSYGNGNNHQTSQNYFHGSYNRTNIWSYIGPILRAMISMINLSKVKSILYDASSFQNEPSMICFEELIYRNNIFDISTPKLKTSTVHYWRRHLNNLLQLPEQIPIARKFPGTQQNPYRITLFGREDTWRRRWLNIDDFLYRINYNSPKLYLDVQRYKVFVNLSLYQQVVIHSQTDLLIEIHGAALTSVMFLPKSAVVVQVSAENLENYFGLMNRILNLTQIPVMGYTLDPQLKYSGKCRIDRNIPLHRCLVVPPGEIFNALTTFANIQLDIESQ